MSRKECVYCQNKEPDGTDAVNQPLLYAQDELFHQIVSVSVLIEKDKLLLEDNLETCAFLPIRFCPVCGRDLSENNIP